MPKRGRPATTDGELTPIVKSHLAAITDELGNTLKVKRKTSYSVELIAKTQSALGMLMGCVYDLWLRRGISFDTLFICVEELSATITIREHPNLNRLDIKIL